MAQDRLVGRTAAALVALSLLVGCGSDVEHTEAVENLEARTAHPLTPTETMAPDPAPTHEGDGEQGGTTIPQGPAPEDPGAGSDPEIPAGCYLVMHTITGDRPFVREIALRSTGEVVSRSVDGGPWEPQGWQETCASQS